MALMLAALITWLLFQPLRWLRGVRVRRGFAIPTALAALASALLIITKPIVVARLWSIHPALVIEPAGERAWDQESVTIVHAWDIGDPIDGLHDEVRAERAAPGTRVRTRLINTEKGSIHFSFGPGPPSVLAIGGVDLHEPDELDPDYVYTLVGGVFPNTPMHMARRRELVKLRFVHPGMSEHSMHLRGHHMLVLKHNGKLVIGGLRWTDTLGVHTGDVIEVGFRADNAGVWMDHCHNLHRASHGMMMHLAYENVTTPYRAGPDTINHPE